MQGNRVFVCGTNAFSPACSWRDVSITKCSQFFIELYILFISKEKKSEFLIIQYTILAGETVTFYSKTDTFYLF